MKIRSLCAATALCTLAAASAAETEKKEADVKNPVVVMETSKGDIRIELLKNKAPETVENFLQYVEDDFYDGTVFHRVMSNFMIQGGGYTPDLREKKTRSPIRNEASRELKNERGTIAMARTADPHSATSQFFINVRDNASLNFRSKTLRAYGYAVFGRVARGMDVVDEIKSVDTTARGMHRNVPKEPVIIEDVRVVSGEDPS